MANPTTNYGFVLPTSTDLVTDLPADFDIALQGVDTRLKALQPGTTLGDIVYSSATANTSTRLPIGTTGQVLAVSGGVPAWTTTADVTPLTTKGDLFTFTTVDARLGVGTNGQVLTADSTAATGLAWATASNGSTNVAGKNAVINSAMNVWQRGTSISLAASAGTTFLADRWCTQTGANQATTVSRQATGDTTNLPFVQYAMRFQRNSGQTGTANYAIMSPMETMNTVPYAGKTVTLSFYARKGANYSATSDILRGILRTGTGTDQNPFSGYTGDANSLDANFTLTTTWQRFSVTGTVAATVTEMTVQFNYTPTGTAGANDYYDITGVQVEIAGSASAFSPNAATYALEYAACQRYFNRAVNGSVNSNYRLSGGNAISTSGAELNYSFPVTMRTSPTLSVSAAGDYFLISSSGGVAGYPTSISAGISTPTNARVDATGAAGLTGGNATALQAASGNARLDFNAEL